MAEYIITTEQLNWFLEHMDENVAIPAVIAHLKPLRAGPHERTCKNISNPPDGFYCSSCHWGDFAEPSHLLTTSKYTGRESGGPNHCPNCGAKVIGGLI